MGSSPCRSLISWGTFANGWLELILLLRKPCSIGTPIKHGARCATTEIDLIRFSNPSSVPTNKSCRRIMEHYLLLIWRSLVFQWHKSWFTRVPEERPGAEMCSDEKAWKSTWETMGGTGKSLNLESSLSHSESNSAKIAVHWLPLRSMKHLTIFLYGSQTWQDTEGRDYCLSVWWDYHGSKAALSQIKPNTLRIHQSFVNATCSQCRS